MANYHNLYGRKARQNISDRLHSSDPKTLFINLIWEADNFETLDFNNFSES